MNRISIIALCNSIIIELYALILISFRARFKNVGKVSGRFEFFQRIFAHSPVSKQFIGMSYTSQRALSNDAIKFSIV